MHPAYSVILFTTLSGAGYGLLIWISALGASGLIAVDRWFCVLGFGIAFAMITIGLLASTFHLGRPERAWRAFSQWRTSWLSREGVAAVVCYVPAGLLALYWIVFGKVDGIAIGLAIVTVICATITVYCTGMIYASLPTIRQWHHPVVPWVFLAFALATGILVLNLLLHLSSAPAGTIAWLSIASAIVAMLLKFFYWSIIGGASKTRSAEAATGLGRIGQVRPLEDAHSQPNFVMREMGFEIGRRHSQKLRRMAGLLGLLTIVLLFCAVTAFSGSLCILTSCLAILAGAMSVGLERWLFFAEAQHVVTVYYRGGNA